MSVCVGFRVKLVGEEFLAEFAQGGLKRCKNPEHEMYVGWCVGSAGRLMVLV